MAAVRQSGGPGGHAVGHLEWFVAQLHQNVWNRSVLAGRSTDSGHAQLGQIPLERMCRITIDWRQLQTEITSQPPRTPVRAPIG